MVKLYHSIQGVGPDLVLLHGWGMHSGIMGQLALNLASDYRVHLIDLPGHGRSRLHNKAFDLDSLSEIIGAELPDQCDVIAWSLSGLPALQLAASESRIGKLVLACSSPQFFTDQHWAHGLDKSILNDFHTQLQQDFRSVVLRFLGLCAQGSMNMKNELKQLKSIIFAAGEPSAAALESGLQILQSSSLLHLLGKVEQPVHWIMGGFDRIVPPSCGKTAAQLMPNASVSIIDKAAHLPFFSHADEFSVIVRDFIGD